MKEAAKIKFFMTSTNLYTLLLLPITQIQQLSQVSVQFWLPWIFQEVHPLVESLVLK